jgi:hypothetical protein
MGRPKGQPRTGGRVKGTPNKATGLVSERCRSIIESPEYLDYFKHRLMVGQLPPLLEKMTWEYAYGKAVERQEISGPGGSPIPVVHDHLSVPDSR